MAKYFNVYKYCKNGNPECVGYHLDNKESRSLVEKYISSLDAKNGIIDKVVITDNNNTECFKWEFGEDFERFKVYQFFNDGKHECVGENLSDKAAVLMAISYCERPAARIGTIVKVIITDSGDLTCFEWQYGKGVVFV